MGEVVNLRRARKAKARSDAAARAEQNRALHGRTPDERRRDDLATERLVRHLDGHRLEPGGDR
ncbi:DUF4169 family protein [uncultured Sphingomonas sp.]|uniref:DUF4169 family protein n=1 Tax=uncultured Sphingomonas sp. TaxID=158754 RepID=UPI0025EB7FEC|nr:DUF4169 family protein [uncultured Sphingomonas sp.]